MSGVAPINSMQEFSPNRRQDQIDLLDQATSQPSTDTPPPNTAENVQDKQAEKTTLYDFRYTGRGSFIDKVF